MKIPEIYKKPANMTDKEIYELMEYATKEIVEWQKFWNELDDELFDRRKK